MRVFNYNDYITNEDRKETKFIQYEEKLNKTTKLAEKVIMSVTHNEQSNKIDDLSRHIKNLRDNIKQLETEEKDSTSELKEYLDDFFDAQDMFATRVVETLDFSLQLTATTVKEDKKTDYEAVLNELIQLFPGLTEKSTELIAKYTEIKEKRTDTRLRDIKQLKESFSDIATFFRNLIGNLKYKFTVWFKSFDKDLDGVKKLAKTHKFI